MRGARMPTRTAPGGTTGRTGGATAAEPGTGCTARARTGSSVRLYRRRLARRGEADHPARHLAVRPSSEGGPGTPCPGDCCRMLIPLALALVVWSLWSSGYFPYKSSILRMFTPDEWWYPLSSEPKPVEGWAVGSPAQHARRSPTASSSSCSFSPSARSAVGAPSSATT
ncbi:hypothetical protein ACR6C2_33115 [Streptomyces sp. INA 01156]